MLYEVITTLYIFAPLAHRLGLYAIKTELEDLSLKYKQPETYNLIKFRLHSQKERRDYLVNQFITPIQAELAKEGIDFTISGRLKSIYSIWNKMQTKGVSFDEIYDLLAIRIVFKPKDKISEKRRGSSKNRRPSRYDASRRARASTSPSSRAVITSMASTTSRGRSSRRNNFV